MKVVRAYSQLRVNSLSKSRYIGIVADSESNYKVQYTMNEREAPEGGRRL